MTQGIHALWQRYRLAFAEAWEQRRSLDTPQRLSHEVQFLPAALALQDQPVHPAPRYTQWAIMTFAVLGVVWACVGEIEVVATARGKVVASGKSKTLQASEVAVVKAIRVHDGQSVKAGEVLVELDTSASGADVTRLRNDLLAAQVDSARATALLWAIKRGQAPASLSAYIAHAAPEQVQAAQHWLEGQYLELRSTLDQVDAEIEQRAAEIQSSRSVIEALKQTLPITRGLAEDYRQLLDQQYVPRHAFLEKQQVLLDQERDMAVQQARLTELNASRKEAQRRRASVLAQTRRAMLDLQQQSEQKVVSLTQEQGRAARQTDELDRPSGRDSTATCHPHRRWCRHCRAATDGDRAQRPTRGSRGLSGKQGCRVCTSRTNGYGESRDLHVYQVRHRGRGNHQPFQRRHRR